MIRVIPRIYSRILSKSLFIQSTPNPNSQQFFPEKTVLEKGTQDFRTSMDAFNSPLATKIFTINGIKSVFLGPDFITVTKNNDSIWDNLNDSVFEIIKTHYESGDPVLIENNYEFDNNDDDPEIISKIKNILENKIRPSIQNDGGDIVFKDFDENGYVHIQLQGACVSCPSSTITLRNGVEKMLMHYIPEVTGIVEWNDELEYEYKLTFTPIESTKL